MTDVKFYRGYYIFENNEWRVGEILLSNNIYEQLRRAAGVVQNIFRNTGVKVEVKGVLVFINPESSIQIVDSVEEETLSYEQIPAWLMKMNSRKKAGPVSQGGKFAANI